MSNKKLTSKNEDSNPFVEEVEFTEEVKASHEYYTIWKGPWLDGALHLYCYSNSPSPVFYNFAAYDIAMQGALSVTVQESPDKLVLALLGVLESKYMQVIMTEKSMRIKDGEYIH